MAEMHGKRKHFGLAIWGLLILFIAPVVAEDLAAQEVTCPSPDWRALPEGCRVRTFEYTMRGMVRLLFFWVGKSGVGGGTIGLLEGCSETGEGVLRGVELLFGSRPEAVPGGHNRWGIGRESALWTKQEGRWLPRWSVFEGFMSKSDEDSLDEVKGASETGPGVRLFEATRSCVTSETAACRIYRFTASSQATYASAEDVVTAYCRRLAAPPDIERSTTRTGPAFGFLSALQYFVDRALELHEERSLREALEGDAVAYAYNARPYTLRCKKVRPRDRLELESGEEFREVLELEFETRNGETGARHSFALVIGTEGEFRGVPLRIEDKPRWWLKVRLELMRSDAGPQGAGSGPGISLACPRPPAVLSER